MSTKLDSELKSVNFSLIGYVMNVILYYTILKGKATRGSDLIFKDNLS